MNCPKCECKMEAGAVKVQDTIGGFLMAGASYQPLFFIPARGKEQMILKPHVRRVAYRCGACNLIVMACGKAS